MSDTKTANQYSLMENEVRQAQRMKSELILAKARLAEIDEEIEALQAQRTQGREYVKGLTAKVTGWADAIALARGDEQPVGFRVDMESCQNIVRNPNAMG